MWPLIVDGIIVVATVSVVALAGHKANWYAWLLLGAGAAASVTANAAHALVAVGADVPRALAASVAAVPPLVLLAITHLTVVLSGRSRVEPTETTAVASRDLAPESAKKEVMSASGKPQEIARRMRADGQSNKAIAKVTGVHPSTVGRWFAARPETRATDGSARAAN
jgi:hypothetical protein